MIHIILHASHLNSREVNYYPFLRLIIDQLFAPEPFEFRRAVSNYTYVTLPNLTKHSVNMIQWIINGHSVNVNFCTMCLEPSKDRRQPQNSKFVHYFWWATPKAQWLLISCRGQTHPMKTILKRQRSKQSKLATDFFMKKQRQSRSNPLKLLRETIMSLLNKVPKTLSFC